MLIFWNVTVVIATAAILYPSTVSDTLNLILCITLISFFFEISMITFWRWYLHFPQFLNRTEPATLNWVSTQEKFPWTGKFPFALSSSRKELMIIRQWKLSCPKKTFPRLQSGNQASHAIVILISYFTLIMLHVAKEMSVKASTSNTKNAMLRMQALNTKYGKVGRQRTW